MKWKPKLDFFFLVECSVVTKNTEYHELSVMYEDKIMTKYCYVATW